MVIVGLHSDRTGERRWHLAIPAFVGAIGLLAAAQSSSTLVSDCCDQHRLGGRAVDGGAVLGDPHDYCWPGRPRRLGLHSLIVWGIWADFLGPAIIGFVRRETGGFAGGLMVIGATLALAGCVALAVASVTGVCRRPASRSRSQMITSFKFRLALLHCSVWLSSAASRVGRGRAQGLQQLTATRVFPFSCEK